MVLKVENPRDIYIRSRDTFFKSLLDGIDTANAAADYNFSLLSMQRHGAIYKWDDVDIVCQSMIGPILKQDDLYSQAEQRIGQGFGQVDHQFEGSFTSPMNEPHLVNRVSPVNTNTGTEPFDRVNPVGEEFNPLVENQNYLKTLFQFYNPPASGQPSPSELHKKKEEAVERHWEKTGSSLLENKHYGKLRDGMTNHDIMMRHYELWKNANPHLVSQLSSMGEADREYNLRKAHLIEAHNGWTSDDHDIAEENFRYDGTGTVEMKHPKKLSLQDYFHGMEFLPPAARHDIHHHGREHGFDSDISVPHITGGRVKRSFSQRFMPFFSQWTREATDFAPNFKVENEELGEGLTFGQRLKHIPDNLVFNTLHEHREGGEEEDLYDRLLEHHNKITGQDHEVLPSIVGGKGQKEIVRRDEKYAHLVNLSELRMLMGISNYDPDTFPEGTNSMYPMSKHPLYGGAWDPTKLKWKFKDYHNMVQQMLSETSVTPNRKRRNDSLPHLAQHMHQGSLPWRDEDWHDTDDHGTLSTPFGTMISHRGGQGRQPETLMDILHESGAHEEEGRTNHSHMFTKDGLLKTLVPNDKNRGLIGPFWHGAHSAFSISPFGTSKAVQNEKSNWMTHTSTHNPKRHNEMLEEGLSDKDISAMFRAGRANNVHNKAEWAGPASIKSSHKSANAIVTMLQMMRSPHEPMSGNVMHFDDIASDELSSTGTARGWHHDQYGGKERERSGVGVEDLEEMLDNNMGHYNTLVHEAHDKQEAGIELTEDERDALNDAYNQTISDKHGLISHLSKRKGVNFDRGNLKYTHEKLNHDMGAITEGASQIVKRLEGKGVDLFPPDNPEVWLGNMLNAFNYGNQFINGTHNNVHGVNSLGIGQEITENSMPQTKHAELHLILDKIGKVVHSGMSHEQLADELGMSDESFHKETIRDLKTKLTQMDTKHGKRIDVPAMKVSNMLPLLLPKDHTDDRPIVEQIEEARGLGNAQKQHPAHSLSQSMKLLFPPDNPEVGESVGLNWIDAGTRHPKYKNKGWKKDLSMQSGKERFKVKGAGVGKTQKYTDSEKYDRAMYNAKRKAESIILGHPDKKPNYQGRIVTTTKRDGPMQVPIGNAGSPDGNAVMPIFSSPHFRQNWGHTLLSDFSLDVAGDGKVHHTAHSGGRERSLVTVPYQALSKVFPNQMQQLADMGVHVLDIPRAMRTGRYANIAMHSKEMHKSLEMLLSMTDSDILIKADQPFMKPMHRIFELKDLDELKGFTGDWVVSAWHQGERMFVKKLSDEISARGEDGDIELPDEVVEAFKKVSKDDFEIDVIKTTDDQYRILDVLMMDGDDVSHDSTSGRIKMLRGGMEAVDPVHVPSASDTKVTDEEGLDVAISEVQKEHPDVILRDAKSTYMKGEKRHPKWVLLSKSKKVDLVVLDKTGEGPYDYRLGIGPITQHENLDDRAVEIENDTYMDVGTIFHDDQEYNPGDLVNVEIDSVSSHERGGLPVYTVHGGSISGKGEGAVVSSETLGLLTKGLGGRLVPHRIEIDDEVLTVKFGVGDVIYKLDEMKPISKGYMGRLAESQRPFWAPLASILIKTGIASIHESEEEDTVGEGEEEGEPIIPPKRIDGTEHWKRKMQLVTKACGLVDRMVKQVGMVGQSFSAGPKGLGIDYATPVESPSGPTSLRDESSLPDFDPRSREGQDPEEEYEVKPNGHKEPQHIPITTSDEVADLSIDSDKAVLQI